VHFDPSLKSGEGGGSLNAGNPKRSRVSFLAHKDVSRLAAALTLITLHPSPSLTLPLPGGARVMPLSAAVEDSSDRERRTRFRGSRRRKSGFRDTTRALVRSIDAELGAGEL